MTKDDQLKRRTMKPEFVKYIPDSLKDGVLYISFRYETAAHKCPCGCGEAVITPITPISWSLTWDGKSVSLSPSIYNRSFQCKSHYWIIKNKVVWVKVKNRIESNRKEI